MLLYIQIQAFLNLTLNIPKGENCMSKRQNIIAIITILIIILFMIFLKDVKVNRNSTVKDTDEASSINSVQIMLIQLITKLLSMEIIPITTVLILIFLTIIALTKMLQIIPLQLIFLISQIMILSRINHIQT